MSENKCSYRIAYEKQKKRAERAEAERGAAKELAESRWVELEALLGEWNLCVKLSGSPTHGGLAGHVGRLRTQAAQTDAAQSTIADLKAEVGRLRDFVGDLADEPCSYGDGCPAFAGTRHGTCLHCQARAALGDAE